MVAGKLEVLGRGERRAARNDERRGRGEATKRQSDAPPPPEATPPPPPFYTYARWGRGATFFILSSGLRAPAAPLAFTCVN